MQDTNLPVAVESSNLPVAAGDSGVPTSQQVVQYALAAALVTYTVGAVASGVGRMVRMYVDYKGSKLAKAPKASKAPKEQAE